MSSTRSFRGRLQGGCLPAMRQIPCFCICFSISSAMTITFCGCCGAETANCLRGISGRNWGGISGISSLCLPTEKHPSFRENSGRITSPTRWLGRCGGGSPTIFVNRRRSLPSTFFMQFKKTCYFLYIYNVLYYINYFGGFYDENC